LHRRLGYRRLPQAHLDPPHRLIGWESDGGPLDRRAIYDDLDNAPADVIRILDPDRQRTRRPLYLRLK
jgi:hypothetical protein